VGEDAGRERPVVRLAAVLDEPLSVDACLAAVADPAAGGVAVFVGAVRDTDSGRGVVALDYSAHPSAGAEIARVAGEVAAQFPVRGLAVVHRVGPLVVGDLAIVAAASAGHRAEAFDACRLLVEQVKAQLPVWKHQTFADGTTEWIGSA
jgi:molybdopterin synthase catalytic subunit